MKRRDFLKTCGITAAAVAAHDLWRLEALAASAGKRPNVVLILADDLGYASIGVQGLKDIPTPNIDSIAKNGVRFTQGYVSCPLCSPTRAGLMSGRYQTRFGHEFNPGPLRNVSESFGLPVSQKTFGNWMKDQGYATGYVGKWHLGYKPDLKPTKRGFDEFFGFLSGGHPYLNPSAQGNEPILRGTETVDEKEYLTDAFTREAVAFVEKHKADPFFLYLGYNAVHTPMQIAPGREEKFKEIADEKRRTFATMMTAMDEGVGAVLKKLRETGVEDDTLIIFLSDNGGPTGANTSKNDPLNGVKGTMYEGGIRVPFVAQWNGHIPAGSLYENPVISLDLLPTAVAAVGGKVGEDAGIDGVNLLPYIVDRKDGLPHDRLFWRMGGKRAARVGDWKMVHESADQTMLFDLKADIGEKNDLAAKEPDKLKELQAAYDEWNTKNVAPLWGGGAARPAAGQRQGRLARRQTEGQPAPAADAK